jgi:hypothetical protein
MMVFEKPTARIIVVLIILWSLLAGFLMFFVNFWVSDFTAVVGVLLGFLTIVLAEKIKTSKFFVKHIFVISSFLIIAGLSIGFLGLSCAAEIITSQFCGERPRVSLLLADFFYIGAPIISMYLFVHIPRFLFQKKH